MYVWTAIRSLLPLPVRLIQAEQDVRRFSCEHILCTTLARCSKDMYPVVPGTTFSRRAFIRSRVQEDTARIFSTGCVSCLQESASIALMKHQYTGARNSVLSRELQPGVVLYCAGSLLMSCFTLYETSTKFPTYKHQEGGGCPF